MPDEILLSSLPFNEMIICFDDIERMSEKYKINDFLGFVNELVENKKCKVLLIANESKIRGQEDIFKEKTIEKTIHFVPDMGAVFDNIVNSYSEPFTSYLTKNKAFILDTLTPKIADKKARGELKKEFSNIRTIKFVIEHFKYAFEILEKKKNTENELIQKQLRNIWLFTLSISNEFKKPNSITFNNRKDLDVYSSIANFDWVNIFLSNHPQTKETERELSYTEAFIENYYKEHSEVYIYYPEIYDLIVSSKTISEQDFLSHLEQSFNVENGKIKPAHEILNKIMPHLGGGGYWSFTDEEFKKALNQLLEYANKGELDDITSYFNAGVYLMNFVDLYDATKADVETKLKNGLNIFLSKYKLNPHHVSEFQMAAGHFSQNELGGIVTFFKERITEINRENDKIEIARLRELFINNLATFNETFLPNSPNTWPFNKPFFHEINNGDIKLAIPNWTPKGITDFNYILGQRYKFSEYKNDLQVECDFFESLENEIKEAVKGDKTLSKFMLQNDLLRQVTKCKELLKDDSEEL